MTVPSDWMNPDWERASKVHDWKNYASSEMKEAWDSFHSYYQKLISQCLQEIADKEEWD